MENLHSLIWPGPWGQTASSLSLRSTCSLHRIFTEPGSQICGLAPHPRGPCPGLAWRAASYHPQPQTRPRIYCSLHGSKFASGLSAVLVGLRGCPISQAHRTWVSGSSEPRLAAPSLTTSASWVMVAAEDWAAWASLSGVDAAPDTSSFVSSTKALAVFRMFSLEGSEQMGGERRRATRGY